MKENPTVFLPQEHLFTPQVAYTYSMFPFITEV